MAATAFKKGQLVTVIGSWDNKGTVYYRHAVVYSCGKKQMILTDAVTGEEFGGIFRNPKVGSLDTVTSHNWNGVFLRMTDAEAEAACLIAGERVLIKMREHYANCISRESGSVHYVRAIQKDLDELDVCKPRAMKRQA